MGTIHFFKFILNYQKHFCVQLLTILIYFNSKVPLCLAPNSRILMRCLFDLFYSEVSEISGAKVHIKSSVRGKTTVGMRGTRGQIQAALRIITTFTGEKVCSALSIQ